MSARGLIERDAQWRLIDCTLAIKMKSQRRGLGTAIEHHHACDQQTEDLGLYVIRNRLVLRVGLQDATGRTLAQRNRFDLSRLARRLKVCDRDVCRVLH